MNEQDYTNATELTYLRIALAVLAPVCASSVVSQKKLKKARRWIAEAITALNREVEGDECDAEDCDEEPGCKDGPAVSARLLGVPDCDGEVVDG